MNVFLATQGSSTAFCISNKPPTSDVGFASNLISKSEFAIIYNPTSDLWYSGINNTNNFYNLAPNVTYKVSNLKIGDTTLTDDELSASYDNEITSNTIKWFGTASSWFNKVYMQCTGVDLNTKWEDAALQKFTGSPYPGNLGGLLFFESFLGGADSDNMHSLYYKAQDDYSSFSEDMQKTIENNITLLKKFFTIEENIVNLTDIAVLEEYLTAIKTLQTKFKDNQDALGILSKYTNIDIVKNGFSLYKAFSIDKDNVCGLVDVLSCGLPQIYYCMWTLLFAIIIGYQVDSPIISTIPVSITFTNVTQ